jgi:cysteinyl-tRNA synthetase
MADVLRRWLEVLGYEIAHVKNITDVGHLLHDADRGDDKVQKQAEREKVHPLEVARRYEREFLEDERALNMMEPAHRPRASEYVREMLAMVKVLVAKGNAYETEDGVYFSVESFPQYGALSGNTLESLAAGARIEVNEAKKHPADFALWKKCIDENAAHILRWSYATGEVSSTTGEDAASGFPGWHIECSAMSSSLLGEQIDIHTGGEDNIFPHHECEIAQSEAASGKKPFVRTWVHRRRINMGEEKMSKSLGNVFTLPDVIKKGFSPLDLRYYFLSVHYRTNLKFTWKGLEDAKKARRKVLDWMGLVESLPAPTPPNRKWSETPPDFRDRFIAAMNADMNTPAALAVVFEVMNWTNRMTQGLALPDECMEFLRGFVQIVRETFGCFEPEQKGEIPSEIQSLLEARLAARKAKNFAESDRLRSEIRKKGYEVKDTNEGQKVRKM